MAPKETFFLALEAHRLRLVVFREPVKESILSYTGQIDPYTGEKWGRVTRDGLRVGYTFDLSHGTWFTLGGEYAHFRGKETEENDSFKLNLAWGREKQLDQCRLSSGIFGSFMHFSRNSNHYTFGHGGYFSPDVFWATGPFVRLFTPYERRYLVDLNLALSLIHFEEERAPYYPMDKEDLRTYPSKDLGLGLGYSTRASVYRLVGPRTLLSAHAMLQRASDYTEWTVMFRADFFWGKRSALVAFDRVRP